MNLMRSETKIFGDEFKQFWQRCFNLSIHINLKNRRKKKRKKKTIKDEENPEEMNHHLWLFKERGSGKDEYKKAMFLEKVTDLSQRKPCLLKT